MVLPQHLDLGGALADREAVQKQSELDAWICQSILMVMLMVDAVS
jgi:hypothetical protein